MLCRIPVCTKCTMPDPMLITAMRFGLAHCSVMNDVADTGNSAAENDPGIKRISN